MLHAAFQAIPLAKNVAKDVITVIGLVKEL